MLITTPEGVAHKGRVEPHTTLVPPRHKVAAALLRLSERLEQEGITDQKMVQDLDLIWKYFATR